MKPITAIIAAMVLAGCSQAPVASPVIQSAPKTETASAVKSVISALSTSEAPAPAVEVAPEEPVAILPATPSVEATPSTPPSSRVDAVSETGGTVSILPD